MLMRETGKVMVCDVHLKKRGPLTKTGRIPIMTGRIVAFMGHRLFSPVDFHRCL
jgi:hypothetical protein